MACGKHDRVFHNPQVIGLFHGGKLFQSIFSPFRAFLRTVISPFSGIIVSPQQTKEADRMGGFFADVFGEPEQVEEEVIQEEQE